MTISVLEKWESGGTKNTSATYTNLGLVGAFDETPDAENGYRADVVFSVSYDDESASYTGPSEEMESARIVGQAQDLGGQVVKFRDSMDHSETYFAPNDIWAFIQNSEFDSVMGGTNFYHGFYGGGWWSTGGLADTNADAGRLVGSTTWTMGDYPDNVAPWGDYSQYTYTVSYDLTRDPLSGLQCADGIDNDGDGLADFGADPGCTSDSDASELGSAQCDNGIDDDNNGVIDHRAVDGDPGCSSLTDTTESSSAVCSTDPADHHYSVFKAPANLNLALAPDAHLGTVAAGFHWCMTAQGPRVKVRPTAVSNPTGWWEGTDNWLLLGALESFAGVTVDMPREPVVTPGNVTLGVTASLQARLNAVDAALSAVPLGKLFKPAQKVLSKHAKKLNPLAKTLKRHADRAKAAAARTDRSRARLQGTQNQLRRAYAELNQSEFDLSVTGAGPQRDALLGDVARHKKNVAAAKRMERIHAADLAADQRVLNRIKTDEAKAARAVDAALKKVKSGVGAAADFRATVVRELYRAVDKVNPAWAREVVRALADQLVAYIDAAVANVKAQVKSLSSAALVKLAGSNKATTKVLNSLKATYQSTLQRATSIGVPIWDADFIVSIGQDGSTSVADNSRSRWLFTVKASPTVETSA